MSNRFHMLLTHTQAVGRMGSNPSIEGTCNIRLRLLSHAPHVKR
jgi:hypothetical protein